MKSRFLIAAMTVAMAMAAPLAAAADTFDIRMTGQSRSFLRGDRFVIPTYHVNFVTSQQATSVVSIGARTRLAMVLQGVDQATMRRLADEAYADLRRQMEEAGLTVIGAEEARAMTDAAGLERMPNNIDVASIGPGITVGSSIRRGWVTVGPEAAPAIRGVGSMGNSVMRIGAFGALAGFNRTPNSAGLVAFAPALTLDFVRMQAARGGMFGGAASSSGQMGFGVLMTPTITVQKPVGRMNTGTPGQFGPRGDVFTQTPFAELVQGGAAVRAGASFADDVDDNYRAVVRARGDAVVVNLPVWEGLVRDAYRDYNAAIVAAIVAQQ